MDENECRSFSSWFHLKQNHNKEKTSQRERPRLPDRERRRPLLLGGGDLERDFDLRLLSRSLGS